MSGKPYIISDIDLRIGQTIKILRTRMGMSQKDLSKILNITFQQVQKYEVAGNRISAATLYKIARALEVPMNKFFEEIEQGYFHNKDMQDLIYKIYRMTDTDKKLIIDIVNRMGA